MHNLTLDQFRTTLETGGVLSVSLVAQDGEFHIEAETRRGNAVLTKARSKDLRRFRNVTKALALLRELGVSEARVDTRNWRPEQADLIKASRPDSSAQLKAAHEAAAYNAWLTGKVEAARQGLADGSNARIDPLDWENRRKEKMADKAA